ncbi:MAG: hypothetical protein KKF88_09675 [Alphaproteobacteria bacterium]|nr:hypothetical protein [Alphaproteobacteria bacterium]
MTRHAVYGILASAVCMACSSMAVAQEAPPPPVRFSGPPVIVVSEDPSRLVEPTDGPYTLLAEDDVMVVFLANGAFQPHKDHDDIVWVTTLWSYREVEDGLSHMAVRSQINCSNGTTLTTSMNGFGPDGSFLGRYSPPDEWHTFHPASPFAEAQAIGCDGAAPNGLGLSGTPVDIANAFRR